MTLRSLRSADNGPALGSAAVAGGSSPAAHHFAPTVTHCDDFRAVTERTASQAEPRPGPPNPVTTPLAAHRRWPTKAARRGLAAGTGCPARRPGPPNITISSPPAWPCLASGPPTFRPLPAGAGAPSARAEVTFSARLPRRSAERGPLQAAPPLIRPRSGRAGSAARPPPQPPANPQVSPPVRHFLRRRGRSASPLASGVGGPDAVCFDGRCAALSCSVLLLPLCPGQRCQPHRSGRRKRPRSVCYRRSKAARSQRAKLPHRFVSSCVKRRDFCVVSVHNALKNRRKAVSSRNPTKGAFIV